MAGVVLEALQGILSSAKATFVLGQGDLAEQVSRRAARPGGDAS